jgi:hypothetical protein
VSGVFQGLVSGTGRVVNGPGPVSYHFRGLPFNAAGEIVFAADNEIAYFNQGIPFAADGTIVGLVGDSPSYFGPNATAYGPNGELVAKDEDAGVYHQGVGYTAGGALCLNVVSSVPTLISKTFTLTPGQVSSTSYGWRASPPIGTLAPDATFAGGSMANILALNDDTFQIRPVGDTPFPGIQGNLAVVIGPYVGPSRIVLGWDGFFLYAAQVPGIYAYMEQQNGLETGLGLWGAPA